MFSEVKCISNCLPKSRIHDTSNGIFTVGVGCEFPPNSLCLADFPRGCLGPCSAWAGHLSCECFLPPNVQEAVWRDVAEILCLHFLFLFLLTPPRQPRVLPAPAALAFLVLGHVRWFMLYKRWEGLICDHQCCDHHLAWPGTGGAVLGSAVALFRLIHPSQSLGWPLLC